MPGITTPQTRFNVGRLVRDDCELLLTEFGMDSPWTWCVRFATKAVFRHAAGAAWASIAARSSCKFPHGQRERTRDEISLAWAQAPRGSRPRMAPLGEAPGPFVSYRSNEWLFGGASSDTP